MSHRYFPRRISQRASAFAALLFCGFAAAAPVSQASMPAGYNYRTLDYPGATATIIWGINDFGDLAGQYTASGQPAHAMVYRNGRFDAVNPGDLFGDNFSAAGGPTDLGTLFGAYADDLDVQHGFVLQWGRAQTVDFTGHLNSNVDGINLLGTIAGVYWDSDGIYHGVVRSNGRDTPIDVAGARDTYPLGINATGEIVGYWDITPESVHGFYRSANGLVFSLDEPDAGPGGTVAFAINDVGQVVGYYADASGLFHGYVQTRGQYRNVDVPGSVATFATTINNLGVIAGEYFDTAGKRHGFVATPQH